MLVTINTDASFNHKAKIAAYAFWISCDEGRFQYAGVLRKKVTRPEEAEFMCVINAVHAIGFLKLKDVHRIIINTDCLNVIHLVRQDKEAIKTYGLAAWGQSLYDTYLKTVMRFKFDAITIEMRHVRSHVSTESKKQWVNDWCDRQAKDVLKKALKK